MRLSMMEHCTHKTFLFIYIGIYTNNENLQLPMQSVPITTDVVSSNLDQGKVYNIIR
jgi:hypothetical protein